ncbi:MAG: ribbon-helix-helix domain-containing protein [Thiobacillaceae bacterium]|jgi:predicted transcriptional regulator|nr:ribbon-helix-helix domain-containing protein [Thiobacillaceae bacterium]
MAVATTLKLPEPLKARIAPLAEAEGKSPHAWMIEALEARVAQCEAYAAFVSEALDAEQQMLRTGEAYAMEDVHRYLLDRLDGKPAKRPRPIKI